MVVVNRSCFSVCWTITENKLQSLVLVSFCPVHSLKKGRFCIFAKKDNNLNLSCSSFFCTKTPITCNLEAQTGIGYRGKYLFCGWICIHRVKAWLSGSCDKTQHTKPKWSHDTAFHETSNRYCYQESFRGGRRVWLVRGQGGGVGRTELAHGYHQDVLLLLVKTYFSSRQPGVLQLPLCHRQLLTDRSCYALFAVHPVRGHLSAHVVIQSAVGIVSQDLLHIK